jgi:FAD-linked oxidoreductase
MQFFENWGKTLKFSPKAILYPKSEAEIQTLVKNARENHQTIRVVGSGHSWTPLIETPDILVSLDKLQGLISADNQQLTATVFAGTKLKQLGELLHAQGLAMENLGDIDVQSIAGAISTGTHGTGVQFGTIATQVLEITFVNGLGELITCSETENRAIFKCAQISLGALGIITRYKLRVQAAYKLEYVARKAHLKDTLARLPEYRQNTRNFEFYWFPHTQTVQLKFMNLSDKKPKTGGFWRKFNQSVLENGLVGFLSKIAQWFPASSASISRVFAAGLSNEQYVNYSHRVFATQRLIKFYEMEYNVPAEHFETVMQEIADCIAQNRFRVHFPIECRWVKADDITISPASGRDAAYIAVHMYRGMPYQAYFEAVEAIFRKYGGRPHFGKMNTCTAADFEQMYPNWAKFKAVRQELDPQGVFLNQYLKKIFGLDVAK